jgi:TonB-linked SusC/RagA family outer membrane protein
MRRLLLLFLWILLGSLALTGYSRGFTASMDGVETALTPAHLQTSRITGKVSDEGGIGMPGVNVIVKGTSNGTTTNAEGIYTLELTNEQASGSLVFSFIGYATQEIPINSRSTIDLTMVSDVQELSEVVVVGYGVQEKRDVTASISSLSAESIERIPSPNPLDAMKGQIAGVDVLQTGGRPGQAPRINIRGRRSLTASNDPLFVIDGIPMTSGTSTIFDFNPADIASIEVLKDAAATAIYGSRGANGVVLITTKRGKAGKTNVSYTGSYGVTEAFRTIPMMNGQQFADLKREANRLDPNGKTGRTAWEGTIPSDDIVFVDPVEFKSATEGRSTDWQDLIFRNGSQVNHQLSITGGSEKTQFNMALSYFNEDGIVKGTDYSRYTARINADHQISKIFKVGISSIFSNSTTNWGSSSVISEAVNQTPLGMPYDEAGNLIFLPISDGIRSNPLNELVPGKRIDERNQNRIFSSIFLEANILEGLQYKFLLGQDYRFHTRGIFEGQFTNTRKNGTPYARLEKESDTGYTLENIITYNKSFAGKHDLGLTFLQSVAEQAENYSQTAADQLPYESAKWYNLGLGTIVGFGSSFEEYQLLSYMGRVNYGFAGKYLFQASYRVDGSSRLAPGHKYVGFPGASVGWRIKDEPFMSNINVITELKLRGSYGSVGNTAVDPYVTQGVLAPSLYDWDDKDAKGFALSQIPSPDLSWEISETVDVGLDFGLFNGRLNGSFDYYRTSTGVSLILRRNLPPSSGYDYIYQNIGGTETKGYELSLSANIFNSPTGFNWSADFNLGHYKEKIVDLALRDAEGNRVDDVGNGWFIGHPVRVFYDYKKIGIWQTNEVEQAKTLMGAFPGEIKLQDLNGDGIISPTGDRMVLGSDVPSAYGGLTNNFSFKGFELAVFLYYRLGFMIDSRFNSSQATMQARYNNLLVDYWTPNNPTNSYPRPNNNQENITYGSTLNYVDGGFVKLRNVTLSYRFPAGVTEKLKMSNLRIFVTAQNPVVWSNYKVFDPEDYNAVTSGEMPSTKLYLAGINLTF